jgi:hypothetical protein
MGNICSRKTKVAPLTPQLPAPSLPRVKLEVQEAIALVSVIQPKLPIIPLPTPAQMPIISRLRGTSTRSDPSSESATASKFMSVSVKKLPASRAETGFSKGSSYPTDGEDSSKERFTPATTSYPKAPPLGFSADAQKPGLETPLASSASASPHQDYSLAIADDLKAPMHFGLQAFTVANAALSGGLEK